MAASLSDKTGSRAPGRPREFDLDEAVGSAILVFRERGYHATSVSDLCATMGLTAGSLYKAFGDKRTLFLAAFDRYVDGRNTALNRLLDGQATGHARIAAVLRFYAESSWGEEGRRGCLVASSAAALATFDDEMARHISAAVERSEGLLRSLVRQGQKDGSIPASLHVDATARVLVALLHGFRSIGRSGRSRKDMLNAAAEALRLVT